MVRGWYTGASGMTAQQWRLDAISNNLANVDVDGYKKDTAIHKAFPELLMRRMNDDGVYLHPFGSADAAPIIGKIGTGVELNELFTNFEQGSMKETESDFDIALDGKGFMSVSTASATPATDPSSSARKASLKRRKAFPYSARTVPSR